MTVRPILLCPLAVEATWLSRAASTLPRAEIVGPRDGSRRWIAAHGRPGMLPILCGLAGSLRAETPVGSAFVVDRVGTAVGAAPRVEPRSTRERDVLETPLRFDSSFSTALSITVDATVTDPIERARLALAHPEAMLIDCEGWWFATACEASGLPWLMVRGVSDGPDERLPESIDRWVDAHGHTRPCAVLRSLAGRPTDIVALPRLARRGRAAMAAVAQTVASTIAALGAEAS